MFFSPLVLPLLVIGKAGSVDDVEDQAESDAYNGGKAHARELDFSDLNKGAGKACYKDYRRQGQVASPAVIYLFIHQQAQSRCGDHSVKEEADAAHYGSGDGLDQGGGFAYEGQQDGENGGASDDPHAVYLCYGHNADVLAVCCGRNGAEETGKGGGNAVAEQRSVETGILQKVSFDNFAGDHLVADVFGDDHKGGGNDDNNG